jgi:hypothetical protein
MRQLFLCVALILSSPTLAVASASVSQVSATCPSALTLALPSPPMNGDIVAGFGASVTNQSGVTMKDSNAVSYTQSVLIGSDPYGALWDKVVSGSPTATYTWSQMHTNCLIDIHGAVYPGTYNSVANGSTGSTQTLTIPGVSAGDVVTCLVSSEVNGGLSGLSSNNGAVTLVVANAFTYVGYTTATSTTSTTFTASMSTGRNIAMVMADYGSAPYIYQGQGMVGDAIFERMLQIVGV